MMEDVVRCPRAGCSGTCLADDEYLARCPVCRHAFCPQCLRLYHRGTECKQAATADAGESEDEEEEEDDGDGKEDNGAILWRIAHEPDPAKRRLLLERQLQLAGSNMADDLVAMKFRSQNFHRCPTCRLFVDKISGCNNVFCPICQANFVFGSS
uniref:RBR-type E3 ubiquitin transferase n=1 Tax=Mesocestoides corti TaxID=53468 RepID=A0A5K3FYI8_MESCO